MVTKHSVKGAVIVSGVKGAVIVSGVGVPNLHSQCAHDFVTPPVNMVCNFVDPRALPESSMPFCNPPPPAYYGLITLVID